MTSEAEKAVQGRRRPHGRGGTAAGRQVLLGGQVIDVIADPQGPESSPSASTPASATYGIPSIGAEPPKYCIPAPAASASSAGPSAHLVAGLSDVDLAAAQTVVWEFQVHGHWKVFADDCQSYIEKRYGEYNTGSGRHLFQVSTGGIKLSIDFKRMTQMKSDSRKVSSMRRRVS